jgi:hypothetical protein
MKKTWRQREQEATTHVRDRYVVDLTPQLEDAFRKTGTQEPVVTTREGQPLYCVCLFVEGETRMAMLSSVPPADEHETCPNCGSRDFEQTMIGFMPWCPDPNKRTCRCSAQWKLVGNDLPQLEARG